MPSLDEDAEVLTLGVDSRVAIIVSKYRSGLRALKLAIEHEVPVNGVLYLIHVESRLHWVPNALGGKFPVEQVHPEMVKKYKIHRCLETKKLLDQYIRLCDKKKIQTKVCYSESDSVKKELVSQILRFRITKLVSGIPAQSLLSRALRKDSISTFVSNNCPDFCTVMVLNKGKLCAVKHATQAFNVECSSPSSENVSRMSIISEMTSGSDDAFEGFADVSRTSIDGQDGGTNTWSGSLDDISCSQRSLFELSQLSSQWTLSEGKGNNGAYYRPQVGVIVRELPDNGNTLLNDRCEPQITLLTENILSEALIIPDESVPQALLPVHEDCLIGPSWLASECTIEFLQNQLIEAQLCVERAQKEAEWQCKKLEAVLLSANKKVMEHERHRVEALRRAKRAMQQATKDTVRYREALAALEASRRDHEEVDKRLSEEIARRKETQLELAMQKQMVEVFVKEAACAKDHAEAERRRCQEALVKLEDMARKVETEYQQRREAEEIASQEVCAKLTALATLEKQQQHCYEFSFQELQSATSDFSEENKLGEGAYGPVYKGELRHTTVAIKVLAQDRPHGCPEFQKQVDLLNCIHHPHLLMLLGACHERGCIVYEYMANGNLEDRLQCKNGSPPLPWYIRFRVCLEVARALLFLHSQPKPVVHCGLKPSNILLDNHFVSKIGDVGLARIQPPFCKGYMPVRTLGYADPDYDCTSNESCECDVYALGITMLQLLTGRLAAEVSDLVEAAQGNGTLVKVFDERAGYWPLEEAKKLACISLQCVRVRRQHAKLEADVLPVLESIQAVADVAAVDTVCIRRAWLNTKSNVPSGFFCPIWKEIMDDPHIAADGFTYEYNAIKVWLQANNTSPMTNLRLDHKNLTPNYTMRSAIKDWRDKWSI